MDRPEPTPPPADAPEARQERARRNASVNCIVLFVLLAVVAATGFGRRPVQYVVESGGESRVTLNLPSLVGLLGAALAIPYLLLRLGVVLRLPKVRKALGLIGGAGLVLHSVVAILFGGFGLYPAPPAGAGTKPVFGQSGPEEWLIDGRAYRVASTYYLRLREGLQYTIEYPCRFDRPPGQMNDQEALAIALPLMRHAYQTGLYGRTRVAKLGEGELEVSRIGVVLVERSGGKTRGYRIAMSLEDLRRRLGTATAPTGAGAAGAARAAG